MNTLKIKLYDSKQYVYVNPLEIVEAKSSPRNEYEVQNKMPVKTSILMRHGNNIIIEEPFSSFEDRLSIAQLRASFNMTPQRQESSYNLCLVCKKNFDSEYDSEFKSYYHQRICHKCKIRQLHGTNLDDVGEE